MKILNFFLNTTGTGTYIGKMVGVGAGAEIFDKLEPEPHKNRPAQRH
jgi:hypothetical protein